MLASLAFRPLPPGLARLLRARPRWSPSRATYGTAAAAVAAGAGAARPRLLLVLAARGRGEVAAPRSARLPWRAGACRGRQRGPAGQPRPRGPAPGGSPGVGGPGLKGTLTAGTPGLPVPGPAPLQSPPAPPPSAGCLVPGASSRLVAALGEPTPGPSGAEQLCCRVGDPGGHQSGHGSCSPGAGLPALVAALAYCYLQDRRSKGDYHCWGRPRGGRSGMRQRESCALWEGMWGPSLGMEPACWLWPGELSREGVILNASVHKGAPRELERDSGHGSGETG